MPRRPVGLVKLAGLDEFLVLERDWEQLSAGSGSPFHTHAWLAAWWRAFAPRTGTCLTLWGDEGELRAGAVLARSSRGTLTSAANDESGDWGVLAESDAARAEAWRALTSLGARRLTLELLPEHGPDIGAAREALPGRGYRWVDEPVRVSPLLTLPGSGDELLASVSRNLRSQVGRRKRALEREGSLAFRVSDGREELSRDLDTVFKVEGSGWKRENGTAILSDPKRERLYREFGARAAERGWLRLYFLELEGEPIAVDFGCAFNGRGYLLKTGFDQRFGSLSPGLVLRGEALRASIEEGLHSYDFLGGSEAYKVRWATDLYPRRRLRAYQGIGGWPAFAYRARVRPVLKSGRDRVRQRAGSTPER